MHRDRVPCGRPRRHPVAVVRRAGGDEGRGGRQQVGEVGVEEIARHEGAEGRHRHGDPRPTPDERAARPLEDRDVVTGARQRDGGGAPGDGAADDADADADPG